MNREQHLLAWGSEEWNQMNSNSDEKWPEEGRNSDFVGGDKVMV